MTPALSSVRRGALFGALAGLLLGGFGLLGHGAWLLRRGPDCRLLSDQECALEWELLVAAGWRELAVGLALGLLGLALLLLYRGRRRF